AMSNPWNRATRLSPLEFAACWAALELGDTPLLLELRSPGQTIPERDQLLAQAMVGLRARQLSDGRLPVPALAELLRVIAAPDYQLDIRLAGGPEGMLLGLGWVVGARGVVVVSGAGPLYLLPMDGARVAATLIGLAGQLDPGVGRPVNIPAQLLDEACAAAGDGNLWTLADQLMALGVARLDATSLARMCEGIEVVGQLGVTGHLSGPRRRAPWVVGFHRTAGGHFMQLRRPPAGSAGGPTVTVCPTDADRLMRQWRELLEHA
ncbi:MAG TPA: ESX secretion-associated protein EspG, partial [Pseudonocardia sp.]|uniref:ESX secretion-associated protein EspG n=1 Tax=Pseudonocardia sp. TaxID=60912 RepID=UPI002CFA3F7C